MKRIIVLLLLVLIFVQGETCLAQSTPSPIIINSDSIGVLDTSCKCPNLVPINSDIAHILGTSQGIKPQGIKPQCSNDTDCRIGNKCCQTGGCVGCPINACIPGNCCIDEDCLEDSICDWNFFTPTNQCTKCNDFCKNKGYRNGGRAWVHDNLECSDGETRIDGCCCNDLD